jgi:RNA polymerase sigma-70 factor (ECF subfamily)
VPAPPEDRLWLFGVARRCVADSHRSGIRRLRLHARLTQQPSQEARSSEEVRPEHAEIRLALASLRPADREVLQLVLWEELSHVEAAALLGCSANALETRYRRARKRLAEAFASPQPPIESIEPVPTVTPEAWRMNQL